MATSSPPDDVHHYVIPKKLPIDSIFNKLPVFMRQGKQKAVLYSVKSRPIAHSFHVATMTRKHSVLNLREINRNNTHTALASVLTYYVWVSLIF
jgi:hypothetical protein